MNILWNAVWHMTKWGLYGGAGLGAAYGTLLYPVAGTLYGGWYGLVAGAVLGIPSGLLVGFITHRFTDSDADPLGYGWTLGVATGGFALAGAWLAFSWILPGSFGLLTNGVPAVIASLTAAYAGKRFAERYSRHDFDKPKRKREELYA